MRTMIMACVLALALGACTDDEPAVSPTATPTATALPAGWTACANEQLGYTIGYPEGWYTASTSVENECRWFDPMPFDLQPGTEAPATEMVFTPTEQPYDEQAPVIGAAPDERLISSEEATVAGRAAIRFEIEQERDGFFPEGTMIFGFLIDGPAAAYLLETIDTGDAAYEDNKQVILTAAQTLRFAAAT